MAARFKKRTQITRKPRMKKGSGGKRGKENLGRRQKGRNGWFGYGRALESSGYTKPRGASLLPCFLSCNSCNSWINIPRSFPFPLSLSNTHRSKQ